MEHVRKLVAHVVMVVGVVFVFVTVGRALALDVAFSWDFAVALFWASWPGVVGLVLCDVSHKV